MLADALLLASLAGGGALLLAFGASEPEDSSNDVSREQQRCQERLKRHPALLQSGDLQSYLRDALPLFIAACPETSDALMSTCERLLLLQASLHASERKPSPGVSAVALGLRRDALSQVRQITQAALRSKAHSFRALSLAETVRELEQSISDLVHNIQQEISLRLMGP
jgi:hypothetical protein